MVNGMGSFTVPKGAIFQEASCFLFKVFFLAVV